MIGCAILAGLDYVLIVSGIVTLTGAAIVMLSIHSPKLLTVPVFKTSIRCKSSRGNLTSMFIMGMTCVTAGLAYAYHADAKLMIVTVLVGKFFAPGITRRS